MGAHVRRCECGHVQAIRYNSCRHRSCPSCRGGLRAQWLADMDAELLPCDHVHVIFTVPEELNRLWQFNRRLFADLLFEASRTSLLELLADPEYLGAQPGIISALHTWGSNLSIHPHVHCLVTAGGLDGVGRFVPQQRTSLLPAHVLMIVFREKLRLLLKQAVDEHELSLPPSLRAAQAHTLLNRLGRVTWNVRIQERYASGISVSGYLARYITGGPIADRRLQSVSDEAITFRYRDYHDGQNKFMRLTPVQFLDRWFEHVPPRGLRMIRRSGLYANSHKATRHRLVAEMSGLTASHKRRTVVALAPERCPLCNTEVTVHELVRPGRPPASHFARCGGAPRGQPP